MDLEFWNRFVVRFRRGEPEALVEMAGLLASCRLPNRQWEDHDDAVQEILLWLLQHRESSSLGRIRSPIPFIRRLAGKRLRAGRARTTLSLDGVDGIALGRLANGVHPDAKDIALRDDERLHIMSALNGLSATHAIAITWRDVRGLSVKLVRQELSKLGYAPSEKGVQALVTRARRALQRELRKIACPKSTHGVSDPRSDSLTRG